MPANTWSYDWDGRGLTIVAPDGRTCYMQGEEGSAKYDELESIGDDELLQAELAAYDHVCEDEEGEGSED